MKETKTTNAMVNAGSIMAILYLILLVTTILLSVFVEDIGWGLFPFIVLLTLLLPITIFVNILSHRTAVRTGKRKKIKISIRRIFIMLVVGIILSTLAYALGSS